MEVYLIKMKDAMIYGVFRPLIKKDGFTAIQRCKKVASNSEVYYVLDDTSIYHNNDMIYTYKSLGSFKKQDNKLFKIEDSKDE